MEISEIVILALIVAAVSAKPYNKETVAEIERINRLQTSWKAGYTEISTLGKHDFKKLLGANVPSDLHGMKRKKTEMSNDIPPTFDARDVWPECASISSIKDQGDCGDCWAVSIASAVSDRLCIGSEFEIRVNLSAANLVTQCTECAPGGGCDGGDPQVAWKYITETGIVTGGDYNSAEGCQPYTYAPTGINRQIATSNSNVCTNTDYAIPYDNDIHTGESYYLLDNDVGKIQTDLLNYGPLVATFTIYNDFQHYVSGVYQRTTNVTDNGSHAVRIIGWGHDTTSDLDYWLVANSWARSFGENGLFRIRRGTNECDIEDYVVGGTITG